MIRLGVNIDHVATLRQARGEAYPDPVHAAVFAELGGADNITCHLREDRRHIQDRDVFILKDTIKVPLNFEMACTDEMLKIALKLAPHSVTLVPEKRIERTTEGGLNLKETFDLVYRTTQALKASGILVSLFIEPIEGAVENTQKIGAHAVEFHTGSFCKNMDAAKLTTEKLLLLKKLNQVSDLALKSGLQVHFGHGLNYQNAHWLQNINAAEEANIGHAIVSRSLFVGLESAVREMKDLLNNPKYKFTDFL